MKKLKRWVMAIPSKLVMYYFSILLIGVACFEIYWPVGLMVVGGLLWLDLFLTDLIYVIKSDRDREGEK